MKKERNYQPVMILLILAVVGVFAWMALRDWNDGRVETARRQETEALKRQADDLARKVTRLEQELKAQEDAPSEEKAAEEAPSQEAKLEELAREIDAKRRS